MSSLRRRRMQVFEVVSLGRKPNELADVNPLVAGSSTHRRLALPAIILAPSQKL